MYCGDMKGRLRDLARRDPAGGIMALFAGRRVHYSYSTRVAIRKACDVLGLGPGDEILVPAYNCGSEVDPLRDAGLAVRLYPLDRNLRIDPGKLERMIGPRTRAIYLTHFFGFLHPDAARLRALCDRRGLWLIEDCALSLLSGDRPAEGRTGDVAVFCFHKFFPVLAGGALVLNNSKLTSRPSFGGRAPARRTLRHLARMGLSSVMGADGSAAALRRMRRGAARGMPAGAQAPTRPDVPAHYYFDPGLRDAPISFFASRPLRAFDVAGTIAARRRNYRLYLEALAGIPGIRPLFAELPDTACPVVMPVLVENRDALVAALTARGIAATPWWAGYNRHLDWSGCEDACHLKDHVLSLPLHQYLAPEAIEHIAHELRGLAAAR